MNIDASIIKHVSMVVNIDRCRYVWEDMDMSTVEISVSECCAPEAGRVLGEEQSEQLGNLLKAVADPTRLRILSMIASGPGEGMCACDMTEPLGIKQPTVSHHLKIMTDAGLLQREKRGVWAYYQVLPEAIESMAAVLTAIAKPDYVLNYQ